MTALHTHGRFVWHDLNTHDRARSIEFFTKLIGWKTRNEDPKSKEYVHFLNGDQDLAGAPALDAHVPPHWLAYVTVDDVAAAAERAKKLGGQVLMGPMHIERVGTMAVLGDPTGGAIAAFRLDESEEPETDARPALGTFCWNELHSTEPEKAAAFYAELFGWSFKDMDMGPMGTYRLAMRGDKQTAGLMKTMVPGQSYWLHYIAVANVDATTKEAEKLGGKVITPPTDIPGMGRFSVLQDPTNVFFALFMGA